MTKKSPELSSSCETTEHFANLLGQSLLLHPTVIALHGDLGAGKTTFVRGMCQSALESVRDVSSPTFTYLHIYADRPAFPIYHFDLYRLRSEEEFLLAGFGEYLNHPGWCFIEWPERIASILPKDTLHIKLSHVAEGERLISYWRGPCE